MAFVPHGRSLVKNFADRPFALVGVNCGDALEKVRGFVKSENANWRHFFDGSSGPIATAWKVNVFPTMYLIDHEGRIAVVNPPHGAELDALIEKLVAAAEAARREPEPKPAEKPESGDEGRKG